MIKEVVLAKKLRKMMMTDLQEKSGYCDQEQ